MYMGENLMKSKSVFSFHLDGESSVDAIVLSKTIADMADLSKEMAKQEDEQAFLKLFARLEKQSLLIQWQPPLLPLLW